MEVGIAFFLLFAILVSFALFRYERPTKPRGKVTGRGGDFQDE